MTVPPTRALAPLAGSRRVFLPSPASCVSCLLSLVQADLGVLPPQDVPPDSKADQLVSWCLPASILPHGVQLMGRDCALLPAVPRACVWLAHRPVLVGHVESESSQTGNLTGGDPGSDLKILVGLGSRELPTLCK